MYRSRWMYCTGMNYSAPHDARVPYAPMHDAAAMVPMDSMWRQHPAPTHHAIPRVWTNNAAPHAAMETPLHLAMVTQRVRPMPRSTEHPARLTRESSDRNSRRYFSPMRHLLGDTVYRPACDGGDSLQKRPRSRPAMQTPCDLPNSFGEMGRYFAYNLRDMGQRFPRHRRQRLCGNRQQF